MVKIYHYEEANKFFIREEVIQDRPIGVGLPANSTSICPPIELCNKKQIPVFNGAGWDIVENTFWRPKHVEQNYDAGRKMDTYKPMSLSLMNGMFPVYKNIPMLYNANLGVLAVCQKTRMVHKKLDYIVKIHQSVIKNQLAVSTAIPVDGPNMELYSSHPSPFYECKFESEMMVYCIRRVLDTLVQLTFILTNFDDLMEAKKIEVDGIGFLLGKKKTKEYESIFNVFLGDGIKYKQDATGFCQTINDLFNSFKHCLIHDESYSLCSIGTDYPSIVTYYAKSNVHMSELVYHNHNPYHLVMGFQDTITRVLENQKIFIRTSQL